MICEEAFVLMNARLDGELDPEQAAALQAHLDACPACRRQMEALEALEQKLSALREPAPEGLKRGVLYRIDQATGKAKTPKRRWFGPGTALGAVAAVLVLLVGLGVIPLKGRADAQQPAADRTPSSVLTGDGRDGEPTAAPDTGAEEQEGDFEILVPSPDSKQLPYQPASTRPVSEDNALRPDETAPEAAATAIRPDNYYQSGGEGSDSREDPRPVSEDLRERCAALSRDEDKAVLLYSEFSAESLLELLDTEAPKLSALLADCRQEERDGLLVFETDCGTVLAIHEWLLSNLPHSELMDGSALDAEMKLMQKMEELDPGSGSLYRVISWEPPTHPVAWPENWPTGWAVRLRTEENWGLFFPVEDYTPNADKPALLAFAR